MFSPSELEGIPLEIQRIFYDLELRIMEDVVERIDMINDISRTTDWRIYTLSRLGISSQDTKKEIQEALNKSNAEIDRIYNDVIKEGYARDEGLYKATGKPFIPFEENIELQAYIEAIREQTKGEMVNLTQSMGFSIKVDGKMQFTELGKYYQRILDNATVDIISGAFDYNSTLKKAINEITNSGIRTVDYASGYTSRIEVAARRALMTGVNQVLIQNTEQVAKDLETEHFEVSWHRTARPTHQVWQGRVYSKQELIDKCGLGKVDGLLGASCYHFYHPFIKGISKRQWTDEQLDEMNAKENKKREYRGREYTTYEATQHQRKLERLMRKYKRDIHLLEKGNADQEEIRNVSSRYRATMQEYVDFSKEMGLPQQRERIYVPK